MLVAVALLETTLFKALVELVAVVVEVIREGLLEPQT
jgi:hypothetical protein